MGKRKKIMDDEDKTLDLQAPPSESEGPPPDELLSHELNDIITNESPWIVRHGISSIAILSLLLILGTWFVPYPDTLTAPLKIRAEDQNTFYGEIVMPGADFRDLAPGEPVRVEVENYPAAEFGYLHGQVARISSLSTENSNAEVHVALPNGMRTDYNKLIIFKPDMKAKATIGRQHKRLLEKLFGRALVR